MKSPADLLYRPRGRFRSNYVGSHPSSEVGGFGVFRDQAPFLRHPDARRIDIRACLRDPFEEIHVRRFEQRRSVDLYAVIDVSASMAFVGACEKFSLVCEICEALAYSATRVGDRFGLIACDDSVREDLFLPATRSRSIALAAAVRLRATICAGRGAEGFIAAATSLGAARKIAVLISDFRWPSSLLERVFDVFGPHDAIPLVILDSVEEAPPAWGLLELVDSESGRRKLVAMRPALRARWIERERERQSRIARLAANCSRPPIIICDAFDPIALSQQLTAA